MHVQIFYAVKTKYFFAGTCQILPYYLPLLLSLSWASYLNLTLHSIFPNVTEICKLKCWALCWIIGYWNLNSNILPSTYLATTTNTPAHNKYIVHSSEERVEWESAVLESVKISFWQFWHWCISFGEGPYWRLLLVLVAAATLNKEKGKRWSNTDRTVAHNAG